MCICMYIILYSTCIHEPGQQGSNVKLSKAKLPIEFSKGPWLRGTGCYRPHTACTPSASRILRVP